MMMLVQPEVSVIVPVYNAERHIRETLDSLACQSLLNFEVIVVDDGSTDRSREIAQEFVANDDRFTLVTGPAQGSAGSARNVGLDLARGEYLAFLDADDLFAPSMLQKMHARATADRADVVLTGFRSFDDATGRQKVHKWAIREELLPKRQPFAPHEISDYLFYVTNPANWNKLFRTEFVRQYGLRFQSLKRANDAYFTFVALAKASGISYVPESLVLYRQGNAFSLQGSIHETPLDFVQAIAGISDALDQANLKTTFRRAFLNLVVTMSLGALNRARTREAFSATYSAIREELFPMYEVSDAPASSFLSPYIGAQATEIVNSSAEHWLFDRLHPRGLPKTLGGAPFEQDVLGEGTSSSADTVDIAAGENPRPRPDVSVIVPVFNSAAWLHECLLSVLGQSRVSMEVICVNDGSTDDSSRILHEYATSDSRVIVVDRPNGGLSAARNSGLDAARGRYVCMIDSDDYWKVDELADLVTRADEDRLDVLLFDAESFFDAGVSEASYKAYAKYYERKRSYSEVVEGARLMAEMSEKRDYRQSACLYLIRRSMLESAELRFIQGILHEDNPFTFNLLLHAARAAHVKKAMYARRVRPGSIMTTGATERSMQGYAASYLDMTRALSRYRVAPELAPILGDIVYRVFVASRRRFLELPPDVADRIREVEETPEAHSMYLMMRHDRDQVRKAEKLSKAS